MNRRATPAAPTVEVLVTAEARRAAMIDDVRAGLTGQPKSIPPVWFYDEAGSLLFDQITRLPEYYLTRAERSILRQHADAIVNQAAADTLVEIGSGTSEKTLILLDAMAGAGRLDRIVLLDISEEVLLQAAATLGRRYGVEVHAVVGDFRTDLPKLPRSGRQMWAFLGSTIGNFTPSERHELLGDFGSSMGPGDSLLLGTDLVKDGGRLVRAYDDSAGVTAAFNLNILRVLNSALDGDFDPRLFTHRAVWNATDSWIEMRLVSQADQTVRLSGLDLEIHLDDGEEILTEISAKFRREALPLELAAAGLRPDQEWTDPDGDFLLTLARPER